MNRSCTVFGHFVFTGGTQQPIPRHYGRRAFTVVEVLVVIAIIGILVGLLLPALQGARRSARKTQCGNNLKQLASAIQQYHDRTNSLPPWWGSRTGIGADKFGGWMMHILPDLDQLAAYDAIPTVGTIPTYKWEVDPSGKIYDAVPATADYQPGEWQTQVVATVTIPGWKNPLKITRRVLVGRKGHGGYPARRAMVKVLTGAVTKLSISDEFATYQEQISLSGLGCLDDPSDVPASTRMLIPFWGNKKWQLTNYLGNAHVFTKFGRGIQVRSSGTWNGDLSKYNSYWFTYEGSPQRYDYPSMSETNSNTTVSGSTSTPLLSALRGLFPPPQAAVLIASSTGGVYNHNLSGTIGPVSRKFGHVTDGLSNTILLAEAMRQCDDGATQRYALLPAGYQTHEHAFGIEPSFSGTTSAGKPFIAPGSTDDGTFGNTLMFQTMPGKSDCNPMRVQANHGPFLMTSMCDGSIRAISANVSRRETIGLGASGRAGFNTDAYDEKSRGDIDGIWDMLMMPSDPATQTDFTPTVLTNTGEIGKEK